MSKRSHFEAKWPGLLKFPYIETEDDDYLQMCCDLPEMASASLARMENLLRYFIYALEGVEVPHIVEQVVKQARKEVEMYEVGKNDNQV